MSKGGVCQSYLSPISILTKCVNIETTSALRCAMSQGCLSPVIIRTNYVKIEAHAAT